MVHPFQAYKKGRISRASLNLEDTDLGTWPSDSNPTEMANQARHSSKGWDATSVSTLGEDLALPNGPIPEAVSTAAACGNYHIRNTISEESAKSCEE